MDLQGVLAGICALGCVCLGLVRAVIAAVALRFIGGPFIGALWDTVSGFLGGGSADDGETEARRVETRRTLGGGEVLRTKAQSLDFDDALRRQGGVIQSQAAPLPSRTSTAGQAGIRQTGTFQAQNAPLQQNTRQTGTFQALPTGGYTPQNPPLQSGGFTAQNAPLQQRNMPQPPAFPTAPTQQTQPPRPNFTPLNPGLARRPTLSQGRALPQNPPVTPGQVYRGGLEGEELPGLRGRRQRRGEEDIYDEEANANDDILSNFGGLL